MKYRVHNHYKLWWVERQDWFDWLMMGSWWPVSCHVTKSEADEQLSRIEAAS